MMRLKFRSDKYKFDRNFVISPNAFCLANVVELDVHIHHSTMKQVGYTLDIVLLCVTVYWLGQHPALQPLKTNGVLSTWAHDQYTALTPNGTFSIESLQPWVAYIVGDDVGSRAIGNSELQVRDGV
jgi:hypothetical protein